MATLKCTGVCHVNGIEPRGSLLYQPSSVFLAAHILMWNKNTHLWYFRCFSSCFQMGSYLWSLLSPIIKQKIKAVAQMQIEIVQSSIKTGCRSSLPLVRPRSPSAALKSRVANLGSGAWMTMNTMSRGGRCTYWGHRTSPIKLKRTY